MKISVVIPTLNEAQTLPALLPSLISEGVEVIVVDGGSTDSTREAARNFPGRFLEAPSGRASQMNRGGMEAAGEILWFLHADTKVPPDWKKQILRAMSDPGVVGGGFTVRIDSPGLRYRFLDLWGRWRTRIQRIFFGDQGIFIRREIFERMGGFSQTVAVEDLDFSRRLSRQGKTAVLPGPLKTSARRWERQGFWRTVWGHSRLVLSTSFSHLPVCPVAVVIMAKAPAPGKVKTRLIPPLSPEEAAAVARQLLQETIALVRGLKEVQTIVAVDPPEKIEEVRRLAQDHRLRLIPQSEGDLGDRLAEAFRKIFTEGARGVIALGADHPGLPAGYLQRAVEVLRRGGDPLVLGPTEDGGYYLIGLNRPHPELFAGIPWSTSAVLQATLEKVRGKNLAVTLLPPWFDVDRPEDLARMKSQRKT